MSPVPALSPPVPPVHVFYGTQTGNAEEIARRIASELPHCSGTSASCLSTAPSSAAFTKHGEAPSIVVLVVATTGEGDPPDKIRPFMRFLRAAVKDAGSLAHVRYAMLGLGDTNYENFCGAAKKVDVSLGKAGATPFVQRGLADDGTGLEGVVEPWIEALPAAVDKLLDGLCAPNGSVAVDGEGAVEGGGSPETAAHAEETRDEIAELVASVAAAELSAPDLPAVLAPTMEISPSSAEHEPLLSTSPHFDEKKTMRARMVAAKKMTSSDALKPVYHVELDCGSGLRYAPGDAFGVLVENTTDDVERCVSIVMDAQTVVDDGVVYELRGIGGEEKKVLTRGDARTLLKQRVDIRAMPKKTLLRALAEHCSDDSDRKNLLDLAAKKARPQPALNYNELVLGGAAGVLDVLEKYAPSCRPPLSLLLDQLPPLAVRYYSAASAPEVDGSALHFAFSLVPTGLATTALAAQAEKLIGGAGPETLHPVLIVPRAEDANTAFRPPKDVSVPYIMVGPGTGVAPFRGFLRQRSALLEKEGGGAVPGETLLFFGCRNEAHDFLYRDELKALEDAPALSSLDVAFSRDSDTKVYVQDRLAARGKDVAAVLKAGGSFFVCGDGGGMAVGVDKALHAIVAEHFCDGDAKEAKAYVKALAREGRYVRDIWYFGAVEA